MIRESSMLSTSNKECKCRCKCGCKEPKYRVNSSGLCPDCEEDNHIVPPSGTTVAWWRKDSSLTELPKTVPTEKFSAFGLENFPGGIYPSCSLHGAMNRVSKDRDWWRCLACNIGCEWKR